MSNNEVPQIGRCGMCQKAAVLVNLACESCREKHGPRCGHIATEIRTNPSFALQAYNTARKEYGPEVLAVFEQIFGKIVRVKIVE